MIDGEPWFVAADDVCKALGQTNTTVVCGAEEHMAAQFVEAITATAGFGSVADNGGSTGEAAHSAPDWTQGP